jgi:hypothetical protein
MKTLDLDRLHKIFLSKENLGRQAGYTTAVCYQALGFAELGYEVFILIPFQQHELVVTNCLSEIAEVYFI